MSGPTSKDTDDRAALVARMTRVIDVLEMRKRIETLRQEREKLISQQQRQQQQSSSSSSSSSSSRPNPSSSTLNKKPLKTRIPLKTSKLYVSVLLRVFFLICTDFLG
jgi:chromatin segregation and condensation protein Rec8/ScpA/Scc1 (kleisin family)